MVLLWLFLVLKAEQRYYGGFNRINTIVNAFDIPTPEFDRLGNMPMFRYEAGSKTGLWLIMILLVGKERYYANKRRAPKTSCAFYESLSSVLLLVNYESYMISISHLI